MKAIVATGGFDPAAPQAFTEKELPEPEPREHDIVVRLEAVGINPVDTKVFDRLAPDQERILGWDAQGMVEAVGAKASRFVPGQTVYYAGTITRDGCNADYQAVDERLVAPAPASLSPEQAAALPLTSLTAWEGLFDRLGFIPDEGANAGRSLLVVGGAGGVGSMVIQLAAWAGLEVAATAGRPESTAWCLKLGAKTVLGRGDLAAEVEAAGLGEFDAIYCTTHMEEHWTAMARVVAPQGSVCLIDDPSEPLDITAFKQKAVRLCWEFMFARPLFATPDMARQGEILQQVAELIDAGRVHPTLALTTQGLTAENVRQAHLRQRSGTMVGKQVITV